MTLADFITKYNGKAVLYNTKDKSLTGQCVQLACFYVTEVLQKPVIWADAVKWFSNNDIDYLRVPYKPGSSPPTGSLVVWGNSLPNSGGSGHIGICIDSSPTRFTSFDSNWQGKYAHTVNHDYSYVIGWMQPVGGRGADATIDLDMITKDDLPELRIVHSEVGGWDFTRTHAGEFDQQLLASWVGKSWDDCIQAQWVAGAKWRDTRGNGNFTPDEASVLVKAIALIQAKLLGR